MQIQKVILQTHDTEVLRDFYIEKLGFQLAEKSDSAFTLKVGVSSLTFEKSPMGGKQPFYHFAFNIPADQFKAYKEWIQKTVPLNVEDGNDEVYSKSIDAHACYFTDPAGNIVELIVRHKIAPRSHREPSAEGVLNISEINVTVREDDIFSSVRQLQDIHIPVRDNEAVQQDSLNFIGEMKDGSFLLLGPEGRRWFFSDKTAEIHPVTVTVNGGRRIELDGNGRLTVGQ